MLVQSKIPNWNKLLRARTFGANSLFQSFLLIVPILASAKIVFADLAGVNVSIPFSFLVLYFAAFSAFIGNLAFDMLCPNIIRQSKTYTTFFRESQVVGVEILSKYGELKGDIEKAFAEVVKSSDENDGAGRVLSFQEFTRQVSKADMIWKSSETWERENSSAPFHRLLVLFFYSVAGALAFYSFGIDAPFRVIGAL